MNAIRRIYDRLTGVLGRDCLGKPLRKGDRVEPGISPERVDEDAACPGVVLGMSSAVEGAIRVENPNGIAYGKPRLWRKLDEGDDADWRRLSESTGWTPSVVTEPGEVPA